MQTQYDAAAKVADAAVTVSGGTWLASLAIANEVMQLISLMVVVISGVLAGMFHYERRKALRIEIKNAKDAE